ncbi:Na+/H+ antiporter [Actinophytocola xinjiangensis]|uniref:Na+/H+ antiporter n=1 Tax=Actinophytocola xinjiangensis TaxID=485602 RepID=A0A7Z1AZI0_9PSEU|nr:Na+/H+ antiporter [Actinophytocola xinjiangensis]OLF10682.1 Na+/H+ antiporter [Actinophytocola xinjiangensis]
MIATLALVLGGLAVVMLAHAVADRTGLPAPILLVVAGIGYGYLPLPGATLELDPEIVLYLIIPPLLYAAALQSSLMGLRRNARTVVGLSVFLVVVTALAVGFGLSAVIAVPLSVAVAIGAAVAPPDPVAALAIGRRAGLPPRLITIVEGEGLLNDATALTILKVAVAAAVSGSFSPAGAVGQFLLVAAGGLAVGMVVALLMTWLRRFITDSLIDNALSLATPFATFLVAEELHVSGVLAVVVAGLWLSHRNPYLQSSGARLQKRAVWRFVEYLLEGYVFVLIGQQLPGLVADLKVYEPGTVVIAATVTTVIVLGVRPLWLLASAHLPTRMHARLGGDPKPGNPPLSGRELLALSWAGTRGVITLAAAYIVPVDVPNRDLLLFCAYVVVLVTLIGQGLTFAPLLRRLRIPGTDVARALTRNQARVAAVEAALARLDDLVEEDPDLAPATEPLRQSAQLRLERYTSRVEHLSSAEDDELPVDTDYHHGLMARREMIAAEREEMLSWRDSGQLLDADLRILERELDHQESILPRDRPEH